GRRVAVAHRVAGKKFSVLARVLEGARVLGLPGPERDAAVLGQKPGQGSTPGTSTQNCDLIHDRRGRHFFAGQNALSSYELSTRLGLPRRSSNRRSFRGGY